MNNDDSQLSKEGDNENENNNYGWNRLYWSGDSICTRPG